MTEKEGMKFMERTDEIVAKLIEVLHDDLDEDDPSSLMLLLYIAGRFSSGILLAVQDETCEFHIEDEFLKVVKEMMRIMGKDSKIQKIKNEREDIEKKLAQNEIKLADYKKKKAKIDMAISSLKNEEDMLQGMPSYDENVTN